MNHSLSCLTLRTSILRYFLEGDDVSVLNSSVSRLNAAFKGQESGVRALAPAAFPFVCVVVPVFRSVFGFCSNLSHRRRRSVVNPSVGLESSLRSSTIPPSIASTALAASVGLDPLSSVVPHPFFRRDSDFVAVVVLHLERASTPDFIFRERAPSCSDKDPQTQTRRSP